MIEEVDLKTMEKLVSEGAILVDVREDAEVAEGSIPGMIHMPLSIFEKFKDQVSKNKPTVFYCRSGRRSLRAAEMAEAWTRQPLYSLMGGFLAYQQTKGA